MAKNKVLNITEIEDGVKKIFFRWENHFSPSFKWDDKCFRN